MGHNQANTTTKGTITTGIHLQDCSSIHCPIAFNKYRHFKKFIGLKQVETPYGQYILKEHTETCHRRRWVVTVAELPFHCFTQLQFTGKADYRFLSPHTTLVRETQRKQWATAAVIPNTVCRMAGQRNRLRHGQCGKQLCRFNICKKLQPGELNVLENHKIQSHKEKRKRKN